MLTAHGITYDVEAEQDTGKPRLVIGGAEIDQLNTHDLFALLEQLQVSGVVEQAVVSIRYGSGRVRSPRPEPTTSLPAPRPAPRAVPR